MPPAGVLILDRDSHVDIAYLDAAMLKTGVQTLLDTAEKVDGSEVRLRTGGSGKAFRVTRAVAQAVGYLPTDEPEPEPEPEPAGLDEFHPDTTSNPEPDAEPAADAPRAQWAAFLERHQIPFHKNVTRDGLIERWHKHHQP